MMYPSMNFGDEMLSDQFAKLHRFSWFAEAGMSLAKRSTIPFDALTASTYQSCEPSAAHFTLPAEAGDVAVRASVATDLGRRRRASVALRLAEPKSNASFCQDALA
jgi:hypothetical protein